MARLVLVAGTASHVGKSTVAAGLCRLLADRGVDVAPFKAQNMSNNARAVPVAASGAADDGDDTLAGEVGVSQYVQARAARVPPTTDHNPVLLKPRGEGESQLVIDGQAVGHYAAERYYDDHWDEAREAARSALDRIAADNEVIVAEGAGSIAEINFHDRDLANVETVRMAGDSDAIDPVDVLLVADIERGGVFAALVGTLELLPGDVRERVAGALVTKFRGDRSLLDPGIEEFEDRTGVPVLGVLPHDDPGLPSEDSVDLPPEGERSVRGAGDGVPDDRSVTVAVPRLPRISNFTDFEPLARVPGVRVAYLPLDSDLSGVREDGGAADAVVLPGTKNTVDDLLALREAGLDERLRAFDGPVVGLCGGYQMLGDAITNADLEGVGDRERIEGIGLLPVRTRFASEKRVRPVTRTLRAVGPLTGEDADDPLPDLGTVEGYEIHAGETELVGAAERPFADGGTGAATDRVLGTYLHGLFENSVARRAFVESVFATAGVDPPDSRTGTDQRESDDPYDSAARLLSDNADIDALF